MLLHNSPFYKALTLHWETFSLVSLIFSASSGFFHCQRVIFAELLLYQYLTLFVYWGQLKLIYNDFWCIHNLINILEYNLHVYLLLAFLSFHNVLYQNQMVGHKSFFIDNDVIILNKTFWLIIFFGFIPFWIVNLIWIN